MNDARSLVSAAAAELSAAGVPSPETDTVMLLAHAWRRSAGEVRHAMILQHDVDTDVRDRFTVLVEERARRTPLQHLTGTAGFRHLELSVGPGVFVPRPETELLIDLALPHLPRGGVLVDLCTGSGALAFAVKQERPDADVHAVELSDHAYAWACRNRDDLRLDVELTCGPAQSAFPELAGAVDVVVSNPPYVPEDMVPTEPEVRDHDPQIALFGGSCDGLRIPVEVASRAAVLLRSGGLLVMEHAEAQGESLPAAIARQGGWVDVEDHPDLTGRPRAVTARRP
ncbi:peptide chain release factor N(5)-glutamine methyltransferase [Leekyejoonella antrihumi]|uniref:peptide chain release factor N(5)-glutamine methyltransferase n=1 Tax=Leekyejoonella antrihumi TaxID=1660198 RepID=A0A563E2S2_9MICO|nr:peptide chain release factor N(5)-glutamine methyltransferase [Leekyejoonella antrihumi]TWP36501.1 peptide chain release factor N(5)-glutamine methyltransferase [Leekyejoonella antrihumi]